MSSNSAWSDTLLETSAATYHLLLELKRKMSNNIENNSTVVAMSIGTTTLKRFYQNMSYQFITNCHYLYINFTVVILWPNMLFVILNTLHRYFIFTSHGRRPMFIKFVHTVQNTYFCNETSVINVRTYVRSLKVRHF